MHSYEKAKKQLEKAQEVLILVLMEDALVLVRERRSKRMSKVLILVLMEDALVRQAKELATKHKAS